MDTTNKNDLFRFFIYLHRETWNKKRIGPVTTAYIHHFARDAWSGMKKHDFQKLCEVHEIYVAKQSAPANPQTNKNCGNCQIQCKEKIGSYNTEELYTFFKARLRETFEKQTPGVTLSDEELEAMARKAWSELPLSILEQLIRVYKAHVAEQAALNKATNNKEEAEDRNKKCNAKNCYRKCSICRKNDEKGKMTKANDNGNKNENKDDKSGKEDKKACGPRKECEKQDNKKDPPKCVKKKKDSGKCGGKKCCGNCAKGKEKPRCKEKAEGKCADKKKDGKRRKDDGISHRDAKKRKQSQDRSVSCKRKK